MREEKICTDISVLAEESFNKTHMLRSLRKVTNEWVKGLSACIIFHHLLAECLQPLILTSYLSPTLYLTTVSIIS